MKVIYKDKRIEEICTDFNKAKRFFNGKEKLALSLLSRVNAFASANVIHDIIIQPQFSFHNLINQGKNKNMNGYFAVDVKTRRDGWRIILRPLNEDEKEFIPCEIDKISKIVKKVEIMEVSNHYE